MQQRKITAAALTLCLLSLPARGAPVALQAAACARAAQYSDGKNGTSVLVIQDGRTVFEHYANGGRADAGWPIFSGTKSFWGIAALIAVGEGLFQLDDPVAGTITEWRNDPRKSKITIRQLLNFTDGLDGASYLHRDSVPDRNAVALRVPLVAPPGSAFIYGPSHLQIFGELLRRKLNGRNTYSYLQERVLGPLGISGIENKRDAKGNPLLATGFHLSARQWARLGEMVLGHGSIEGRQVISADLLQRAFTGSAANPSYGLTFWLNRPAGFLAREADIEKLLDLRWQRASWRGICISRAAPPDMIVGLGSHYQRLFIIPSMNAVIVRQSSADAKFSDPEFLRLVFGR
ncbi:MAG TPA: serine hydrolase [Chthoniobacterales bacterium]|jgi:CubicO group peptidase (beta-lactamase class C family)